MKRLYDGAPTPNPRSILIDLGANLPSSPTTAARVKNIVYALLGSPDFAIQR